MTERMIDVICMAVFLVCYHVLVERGWGGAPFVGSIALTGWYAREHLLLCLVQAFFITVAMSVFISNVGSEIFRGQSWQICSLWYGFDIR